MPLKRIWSFDAIPPEYEYRDGKPIPYYDGDVRKANSPNKNDGKYVGPSEIIGTPVFAEGRVYFAIGQDPAHGRGRGMLYCIDAGGQRRHHENRLPVEVRRTRPQPLDGGRRRRFGLRHGRRRPAALR